MTGAADLLLTDAAVHTLDDEETVHEAVAVRDGRVVALGTAFDLDFLADVETRLIDCEGRVVLPGFVDAHARLATVGADVSDAADPADGRSDGQAVADTLRTALATAHGAGITTLHAVAPGATAASTLRRLDVSDELSVRVALWPAIERLETLGAAGLAPGHGSEHVWLAGVAADATLADDAAALAGRLAAADAAGYPVNVAAADEDAVATALEAFARRRGSTEDDRAPDHRLALGVRPTAAQCDRIDDLGLGVVALGAAAAVGGTGEPAGDPGSRGGSGLGPLRERGVALSFGSDREPPAPVEFAGRAATAAPGSLSITDSFRPATGAPIERGAPADLVVLDASPWEHPEAVANATVAGTVVDGRFADPDR